ncbi:MULTISPECIES: transcription antitermination factor NusB [Bifidobacterium]|jgi:N utilization substance protein B|uniref:transcription antitermination factor NusB n=1 Tax=Bifidobacterium TaxID=1678 RepID=UPI002356A6F3|nr:transcription antitermination factor NusB [Bifidobacterium tibiigranuli]MCI1211286.1 transcription antitermination factor NusB [Bifidobacterium tibiigranuli]MCI1220744.1 transcription antitermination factor NusB [Bifidobacterium tibiigranuli]MCI1232792.1 transcription antitermination factor NusB [Bifidobacterium tibiigranuli]
MARSTARKRALNTLYEADEKGQDFLSLLAERIAQPGAQTPLPDYAIEIVRGVADNRVTIDRALDEHSTGWKIRRMAVVDRNILRIAAWEILRNDEVPDKVAIDEALSLARTLSDDDSLSFIHGLLSALRADKEQYPVRNEDDEAEAADASEGDESSETAVSAEATGSDAATGSSDAAESTEPAPSNPADSQPDQQASDHQNTDQQASEQETAAQETSTQSQDAISSSQMDSGVSNTTE